jgi:hypothetical protein
MLLNGKLLTNFLRIKSHPKIRCGLFLLIEMGPNVRNQFVDNLEFSGLQLLDGYIRL